MTLRILLLTALCSPISWVGAMNPVPTDMWLDFMRPAVTSPLCNDKNPIRQCFRLSKSECEQAALAAASTCSDLLKQRMPAELTTVEEARHWGGTMGVCTAKLYAARNSEMRVTDNPDCSKYAIDNLPK